MRVHCLLLRKRGRGGRVGCLRRRDGRAEPRAVGGRWLLLLWSLLEGSVGLVPSVLGHGGHIGLTEELSQLVGGSNASTGRAGGGAVLDVTEVRRRVAHKELHLVR